MRIIAFAHAELPRELLGLAATSRRSGLRPVTRATEARNKARTTDHRDVADENPGGTGSAQLAENELSGSRFRSLALPAQTGECSRWLYLVFFKNSP